MATLLKDIIQVLKNSGGVAHLSEIQNEIARIRKGKLKASWKYQIQENLYRNSKDSVYGRGEKYGSGKNIFYSAEGIGKGVWGLTNFKSNKLIFGNIENVKVGQVFKDRAALSKAGVHTPPMHGIWSRENEGACSIVLSGGYEDDIDELDYIFYTGQGGQDIPGGKQVSDQEFVKGNKGLMLSCKYSLPVRVTRGYQIKNGPKKGYRYDGLYYVNRFERVKGKSGYYICRFHLSSEKQIDILETTIKKNLKPGYKRADRAATTVSRIKRDVSLSENIKEIYDYKCQVCNVYLKTPYGGIAIGAHIKGLGKPHNGPDVIENMICLCPNHHEQFDDHGFYIDPETYQIKGLEGFEGKKITLNKKHNIEKSFLKYHLKDYNRNN